VGFRRRCDPPVLTSQVSRPYAATTGARHPELQRKIDMGHRFSGTLLRVRRGCGRSLDPARTSLVAEASIRKHEEPSKLSIGKRDNDEEWHVHVVPPLADSKVVLCPCASSLMPLNLPHIPDFPSMRKQEARDIHRRQRRIDMALIGTPFDVGYALLGTRRWACSHIVRGGGMQTKNESHASMRRKRRNFR